MILVAGNQKDSAQVAVRDHTLCGNLAAIVNKRRHSQHQVGPGGNEGIQVRHVPILPEKSMLVAGAIGRTTHDLAFRVYANRDTARVSVLGPKVGDPSLLREKSMNCRQVRQLRLANQFTSLAEANRFQELSS